MNVPCWLGSVCVCGVIAWRPHRRLCSAHQRPCITRSVPKCHARRPRDPRATSIVRLFCRLCPSAVVSAPPPLALGHQNIPAAVTRADIYRCYDPTRAHEPRDAPDVDTGHVACALSGAGVGGAPGVGRLASRNPRRRLMTFVTTLFFVTAFCAWFVWLRDMTSDSLGCHVCSH